MASCSQSPQQQPHQQQQRPHQQQQQQQQAPTPQSGTLTFDEISKLFSLPIAEAAPILGVCTSALKKICRDYGIVRWPYRKFLAGKTVDDIRRDVAKERAKELTDSNKLNQRNDISNVISSSSGCSSTLMTNPGQDSSKMQRVSVPGHFSQPQGNRFIQNGWTNTPQLNQSKSIPTFMDEFKYGFPADGLSSASLKWWGVTKEDTERTLPAEATTEKDENKEAQELPNGAEEPDSGAEDNVAETMPSALLCSLRRKSVEYGRETLKRGNSVPSVLNSLTKRQKLTLTQIFGSSLPEEWKANFS